MDKSLRALHAATDNAAAIDALMREVKRAVPNVRIVTDYYTGPFGLSFDLMTSDNGMFVIVVFESGSGEAELKFNGVTVGSGTSPIVGFIEEIGEGELLLTGDCTKACALIISK